MKKREFTHFLKHYHKQQLLTALPPEGVLRVFAKLALGIVAGTVYERRARSAVSGFAQIFFGI